MRKLTVIFLLFWVAFASTASNKAILIGVSNYPEGSGWCKLNAHNDVELLQNCFSSSWDIITLEDQHATKHGIATLLSEVCKNTCPGDTIFIHFSGHGQQMLQKSQSDDEPDALDESIVPYDAMRSWSVEYTGQNHFRDNDFSRAIDRVRDKAGMDGFVIVVIDACHSDSMERGEDNDTKLNTIVFRGVYDIFGQSVPDSLYKHRFKSDTSNIAINSNAHVVYISACQAHSRNQEIITLSGDRYGSLSYAVANSLKDYGLSCMPSFLDGVKSIMGEIVPGQRPVIRTSFLYQNKETYYPSPITTVPAESPQRKIFIPILIFLIFICGAVSYVWKRIKR